MNYRKLQCTHEDCGQWFRAPESALGRMARCPHCKRKVRLPGTVEQVQVAEGAKLYRIRIEKGPAFVDTEVVLDTSRSYTFGKSDTCDQQLPGPSVSRRHFTLHWINGKWVIEDLNSTNGTEIDGLPVTKQELRGDEKIQVGAYTLHMLAPGKRLAPPQVSPAEVVAPEEDAEPVAVQGAQATGDKEADDAARLLANARGYTDYQPEKLEQTGKESSQRYTLGLATRLAVVAGLLVAVTWLSIWGKHILFGSDDGQDAGAAVQASNTDRLALPVEFTAAIGQHDFEGAQALLAGWEADQSHSEEMLVRMRERFDSAVKGYARKLLSDARAAIDDGDWDEVDRLLKASEDPLLGPPKAEWRAVRAQRRQRDEIVKALELKEQGSWSEALATLIAAESLHPRNRHVSQAKSALVKEMGGGLSVELAQSVAGAKIYLAERELGAPDQEYWQLGTGKATVLVSAPGYFTHEEEVKLHAGELVKLAVTLQRLASETAWVMTALQRVGSLPALWVVARHFSETDNAEAELAEAVALRVEQEVTAQLKPTNLLVYDITYKDGRRVKARVWGEMSGRLSVQKFPDGDSGTIAADEIASKKQLTPEAAGGLVVGLISRQRDAGQHSLETLEQLAKLWLDMGPDDAVAGQLCAELVADCLKPMKRGCMYCLGSGSAFCDACGGKTRILRTLTCERCTGKGDLRCPRCKGSGRMDCTQCRGTGTIKKKVLRGHTWVSKTEACPTCGADGQVTCRNCKGLRKITCGKCKGRGEVEKKVPCEECEKGRITCPVCEGTGSKEAMDPEVRLDAERTAAQLAAEEV